MRYYAIITGLFVISCANEGSKLEEIGELSAKEISGIETIAGLPYIFGIEDHGNDSKIFAFEQNGKTAKELIVEGAKNNDWEDLTSDKDGNLYIGDFGNNDNDRKDLAILKINRGSLDSVSVTVASATRFHYPEQTEFPPKKSNRIFDVEAFYEHNGNFYLFTKNRSSKFDGSFAVYKVPNKPGQFAAQKIGTLTSCSQYKKCAITGADISPDGKTVALIASDRLWLLTGFTDNDFSNAKMDMFELGHQTQKEGICFKDADTLLISDERDDNTGGKLYRASIAALKGKAKAK